MVHHQLVGRIHRKLSMLFEGSIRVPADELNLDLTLLGGQSFRWQKVQSTTAAGTQAEWRGVACDAYWVLTQNADDVKYTAYPLPDETERKSPTQYFRLLLKRYFRLDFDLKRHVAQWREAHDHFAHIAPDLKAVRVLSQEPLENILSFMCSQNNNIKRISTMIEWLCVKYGRRIGEFNGRTEYAFPTLQLLARHQQDLESEMRQAKFGYRAKFISQTIAKIVENGGDKWFEKLRQLPYDEARLELVTLPGIGFKVADCICLMSLNHLQSVPIDTHIYKIAQSSYMPQLASAKSVTPKIYEDISRHFRNVYGAYAGWAQAVLFCSGLQQFQVKLEQPSKEGAASGPKAKKKRVAKVAK